MSTQTQQYDVQPILGQGPTIELQQAAATQAYAARLLNSLGARALSGGGLVAEHPAQRWADSGLMYITGTDNGPPLTCPVPLASCADDCLEVFRALTGVNVLGNLRGAQLLAERAALTGFGRKGATSPGGSCRLLETSDGCIGVSLARPADWEMLPAWLQQDIEPNWEDVTRQVATRNTGSLLAQGRLLGLALAEASTTVTTPAPWYRATTLGAAKLPGTRPPRVVDLSSLWAGPLCSHLWQQAGAEVIKVESSHRMDGARRGSPAMFDLLNQGKKNATLDLSTEGGRASLRSLIVEADIVLEASRPRALRQMGIVAEELIQSNPGLTWVSITGYGRQEPQENWIAFGDDAGIAGGLSAVLHQVTGKWLLCGDAIADPLTGLHAALAGWAGWLAGGGLLLDLSLVGTVRSCIANTAPPDGNYATRQAQWNQYLNQWKIAPQPPTARDGITS